MVWNQIRIEIDGGQLARFNNYRSLGYKSFFPILSMNYLNPIRLDWANLHFSIIGNLDFLSRYFLTHLSIT
jgi:hypothetical protein